MINVLLLLALPEKIRMQYYTVLREKFPGLTIHLAEHVDKADPYLGCADVLVTFGPHLGERADQVFRSAKNLKWVQALGTGVDNIADVPSLGKDVVITNMHGVHGAPMSEAAIMSMLALARDLPRVVRNQDRHSWDRWPAKLLSGKTAGIFGVGSIAEALAPRCKALGMTVVGITTTRREVEGFDRMRGRDELLVAVREFDFFVLLTPYTPQTHHIVNAEVLAAMKPTAYLINLARGGIVDEQALLEVLREGKIAGAALDVFGKEPLPEDHPFWSLKNLIITPHLGGLNEDYAQLSLPTVEENLRRFTAGDTKYLLNLVKR